jgi:mRNA interferase MazF
MKEGEVVLATIPQADWKSKNRPVIVLREMPFYRDLLVCGVSTQVHRRLDRLDELMITPADPDFGSSGLLAESLIRLSFLVVIPLKSIAGSIGSISPDRHRRLLRTLAAFLTAAS